MSDPPAPKPEPHDTFQQTIKCSANSVIKDKIVLKEFENISLVMSKVSHETCLFVNAYLLYTISKNQTMHPLGDPQVLFKNAMRILTKEKLDKRTGNPELQQFYKDVYKQVGNRPVLLASTLPGAHFLENAAKELETNMLNHFIVHFEKRLKAFVRAKKANQLPDKKYAYDMAMSILKGIDGWKPTLPRKRGDPEVLRVWTDQDKELIIQVRTWMGLSFVDNSGNQRELEYEKTWFKKKETVHNAVFVHYKILEFLEQYQLSLSDEAKKTDNVRLFSLIPQRRIRHAHILVTNTNIGELKNINTLKHLFIEVPDHAPTIEYWKAILDFEKLGGKKWEFSGSIRTDGSTVSVLYSKKVPKPKPQKEPVKHDISIRKETKKSFVDDEYFVPENSKDKIEIIGIDPGRTDLMYTHNFTTGQEMHLSKRQYYDEAFMFKNAKFWKEYRKRTVFPDKTDPTKTITLDQVMTQLPSFKTASYETYMARLPKYWLYEAELWTTLCIKKRNANAFTTYRFKNKCIDSFFQRVIKDTRARNKVPVFSFGAAKFATSSKGEISGPLKALVRRAELCCNTVMMQEYNTSKLCSELEKCPVTGHYKTCECELEHPARHRFTTTINKATGLKETTRDPVRPLHNLVRCPTKHNNKFRNRDSNASQNIAYLLHSILFGLKQRPAAYSPPESQETKKKKARKASQIQADTPDADLPESKKAMLVEPMSL